MLCAWPRATRFTCLISSSLTRPLMGSDDPIPEMGKLKPGAKAFRKPRTHEVAHLGLRQGWAMWNWSMELHPMAQAH